MQHRLGTTVKNTEEYERLDTIQDQLKILANATSYGIFIEIITEDQPTKVQAYGLKPFPSKVNKTEEFGRYLKQNRGNYPEAVRLLNESLAIKRKLGNQSAIATTFGALGNLAENQKDLEAAEKYYGHASEIFEKLEEKPNIEIAKKNLERIQKLKQKP